MPELRMPDMSRRTVLALTAVIAGIIAIAIALLSGLGSDESAGGTDSGAIKPIAPIDPKDKDARELKEDDNPLDPNSDPFATSFGGNNRHKITVRVSSDTTLRYVLEFRDGHKQDRIVAGGATITRTIRGGFPLAQVGVRIAQTSRNGSCSITVDGVKVTGHTTKKPLGIVICTA